MSERILLDACVLYPTLLRKLLIGSAERGLFVPLWSPRILDEWRHAAARSGQTEAALIDAEIARLSVAFPDSTAVLANGSEEGLSLPDADDVHVLAAALSARADSLLTLNLKDFPTRTLTRFGLFRREPDGFLLELLAEHPDTMRSLVAGAAEEAARRIGGETTPRSVLKRARLPRMGKALYAEE
ncbi:MAG: PIN domain-containing protein [Pseudomonadota bacterium]